MHGTSPGVLPWVLIDDALVASDQARVSPFDRGYLHGDGVFETMLVVDGQIRAWDAHRERLAHGIAALGFRSPDLAALDANLAALVTRSGLGPSSEAVLRVSVSSGLLGEATPRVVAFARAVDDRTRLRRRGLVLYRAPAPWDRRGQPAPLSAHKTLAYVANNAAQRLHAAGHSACFEAAFLDADEHLLEGGTTNLFVVDASGVVLTAPDDGAILPGVTRREVLGALARLAIPVRETRVAWADVCRAPEVFATSSTLPIAPIIAIEGVSRPVAAGGIAALLSRART